jgi:hypothetical protein
MPPRMIVATLQGWHKLLGLRRQVSPEWHRARLTEEKAELIEATGLIDRMSEGSDVIFAISRAHHDGFLMNEQLPPLGRNLHLYLYMLGKFTMRWAFYRTAAWLSGAPDVNGVREVINPKKDYKLVEVAGRHDIDVDKFKTIAVRLRTVFPLLP